jgi:hypothetical protein
LLDRTRQALDAAGSLDGVGASASVRGDPRVGLTAEDFSTIRRWLSHQYHGAVFTPVHERCRTGVGVVLLLPGLKRLGDGLLIRACHVEVAAGGVGRREQRRRRFPGHHLPEPETLGLGRMPHQL